jgi:hypothetical protein
MALAAAAYAGDPALQSKKIIGARRRFVAAE